MFAAVGDRFQAVVWVGRGREAGQSMVSGAVVSKSNNSTVVSQV